MTRVVPLAAALLIAAGCAGSSHAAQQHHHYFLIGRRECARALRFLDARPLRPVHIRGVVMWNGFTTVSASVNATRFPKPYRHDVVAGCNAAG